MEIKVFINFGTYQAIINIEVLFNISSSESAKFYINYTNTVHFIAGLGRLRTRLPFSAVPCSFVTFLSSIVLPV